VSLDDLLAVWDHLPAAEAVARAWLDPGPKSGTWHQHARRDVAELMPLLARALDRLLGDLVDELPSTDPDLWAEEPALADVGCSEVSCRCGHLYRRHAGGGARCRARDCGCSRFVCSCRGVRGCGARPPKRL
jgi:hypothetical protein